MLKILNDLQLFFEDNYRRIHVREYAIIQKISPPTASKNLEELHKKQLLKKEIDKQYFYYFANKDSDILKDLQRVYYKQKLTPFLNHLEENMINPVIILFGSLAKTEAKQNSDIDIAVFTTSKKEINTKQFEKNIQREIQLFTFKTLTEVPEELKNNILNGYIMRGMW
ncbi:MAG: nucleotidyltransferase domain-containing protein [DPANN group archaeon]|nr:nucleotidyltransferase domain-containing protein [DPANN group archaeon]